MPSESPVVFSQVIEGFLRAIGPKVSDEVRLELKKRGLDLNATLDPAYPLERWVELARYGGTVLAPGQPRAQQQFELGQRFIEGYQETLVGKAMLAALRVFGPKRTLERMTRNFRSGNNYTQTKLELRGPTSATLWFNRVQEPEFYRGVLTAGLGAAGVGGVQVEVRRHDAGQPEDEGCWFDLSWS